ncbi:MAG: hypothetical protein ACREIA_22900 [Opitutaceae bacterium]
MISWLQSSLQKHIKLMMVLLLIAVIVPFVFVIGNTPGLGQGDRKTKSVDLFGVPFTTDADRQSFFADGQLSFYLTVGQPYYDPNQVQLHAFSRAASLQLADKLGIPQPTEEQKTEFIRTLPAFIGQDGNFDASAYASFRDNMTANPQISPGRVSRVISEDWRIDQAEQLLGGPGYVLVGEVENALARADTRWSVSTATLDLEKIETPAQPAEEELRAWFDSHPGNYRIPERVKVSYVRFPASEFASRVELKDEDIVAYFEQNKARYAPPPPQVAEGETPPPPAEVKLADVRDRVVADLTAARARTLAEKAAADFAYLLFDRKITPGTEAFDQVVAAQNLKLESPPPFSADESPASTGWTAQVVGEAFRLGENRAVSDPMTSGGDSFVLFFEERIPSTDAEFFAVRDRVLAEVVANKRNESINARGEELRTRITDAVKSGTSFTDAAKDAALEAKQWENFSLRELPEDIDYSILSRLEDLALNEVSPMAVQGNRGVIMMVTKREAPQISNTDTAFEEARTSMMQQAASATRQGLIGGIVQNELDASGLNRESE